MFEQRVEDASNGEVKKAVWVARPFVHQFEISKLSRSHSQLTLLFTANTESPSMKNITRYIDRLTNRIIPNGPAQACTRHQDDDQLTLPSTAVPSSSFPTRPGSSTPLDSRSKRSLISRVHHRIGKKSTNKRRCTSLAQLPRNNC